MKKGIWRFLSLCFGILIGVSSFFQWFSYAELMYEDILYQKEETIDNQIKIIAIDDRTLSRYGEYENWSRQIYANLVRQLTADGNHPAVIAFDVMFLDSKETVADEAFAKACRDAGNVVVASKLITSVNYNANRQEIDTYYVEDCLLPYEELQRYVDTGFSNIILDNDGYVRHSLYSVNGAETNYDSFSNVIYHRYLEACGLESKEELGDGENAYHTSFLIDYSAKPGSYEMISMCDVLDGTVPASVFDDGIVIIGGCSEGLRDSYGTPIDRRSMMYGVEINANIVQALLDGKHLSNINRLLSSILCGLFAAIFFYLMNQRKVIWMTILLASAIVGHFCICLLLIRFGIILPILYPLMAYILSYIINLAYKYAKERRRRIRELRELLFSMAEAMTEAIDGRTPYNANHTRKVAEYAVSLAEYMNALHRKGKSKRHFTKNEIDQLHLAALLHDVGKLDVPLEVLDKPSRLGIHLSPLLDRLQINQLEVELAYANREISQEVKEQLTTQLQDITEFIRLTNSKEWLSDSEKKYLESMKEATIQIGNQTKKTILTKEEYECLTIAKGTLTPTEMEEVHKHAIFTDKILSKVTFGKNYRNVKTIAASHHEYLNGKGYPNGLDAKELSTSVRILTIADIYDALTADDRPYKKAKTQEEAFQILKFMEKDGQIDGEILQFANELWKGEH